MRMRKAAILFAAVTIMVATMPAGTALAKVITGTNEDDTLIGTNNRDQIRGLGGATLSSGATEATP
jgi:hypothetical protein